GGGPRQQLAAWTGKAKPLSYRGLSPVSTHLRAPALAARWTPVTSTGMTTSHDTARAPGVRREEAVHGGADRAGRAGARLLPDPADHHRHQCQLSRLAPARSQEDLDRPDQLRLRHARRRLPAHG